MRLLDTIAKLPTTNLRIAVTLAIWVGTAIHTWAGGEVGIEFLGAIVTMSGLDALQFVGKRRTQHNPKDEAEAVVIRNGSGEIG